MRMLTNKSQGTGTLDQIKNLPEVRRTCPKGQATRISERRQNTPRRPIDGKM